MSVWFVVVVPPSSEGRNYCYGPYSEKDAKAHYSTRVEFYGKEYKVYLTSVENES